MRIASGANTVAGIMGYRFFMDTNMGTVGQRRQRRMDLHQKHHLGTHPCFQRFKFQRFKHPPGLYISLGVLARTRQRCRLSVLVVQQSMCATTPVLKTAQKRRGLLMGPADFEGASNSLLA